MLKMLKLSVAVLWLSCAFASADDTPSPAASDMPATALTQSSKRDDCRAQIKQQGLKAQAASDSIQICMAQARLDCTKDAVSRNLPNAQRRDFIRTCVNGDR